MIMMLGNKNSIKNYNRKVLCNMDLSPIESDQEAVGEFELTYPEYSGQVYAEESWFLGQRVWTIKTIDTDEVVGSAYPDGAVIRY